MRGRRRNPRGNRTTWRDCGIPARAQGKGTARQAPIRLRNQVRCRLAYCRVASFACATAASRPISPRRWATSSGAPIARDEGKAGSQPAAPPGPRPARPRPSSRRIAGRCARPASRARARAPGPSPRPAASGGRRWRPASRPAPGPLRATPPRRAAPARDWQVDPRGGRRVEFGHHRGQSRRAQLPVGFGTDGGRDGRHLGQPLGQCGEVQPRAAHDHRAPPLGRRASTSRSQWPTE